MPFVMGKGSAWDFFNPKNLVFNKSLEQNLKELSVGGQILGTVIPSAIAYKLSAAEIAPRLATQAATTQITTTSAAQIGGLPSEAVRLVPERLRRPLLCRLRHLELKRVPVFMASIGYKKIGGYRLYSSVD